MRKMTVTLVLVGTFNLPLPASARSPLQRDVESYAIATCLGEQSSAYLKDQADGWGSIVIQRGHGRPEPLKALAASVRAELKHVRVYQIEDEQHPMTGKAMPIATCAEIIDRPAIKAAMARVTRDLAPSYRMR